MIQIGIEMTANICDKERRLKRLDQAKTWRNEKARPMLLSTFVNFRKFTRKLSCCKLTFKWML